MARGLREWPASPILNLSRTARGARSAIAPFRLRRIDAASDSGAWRRE